MSLALSCHPLTTHELLRFDLAICTSGGAIETVVRIRPRIEEPQTMRGDARSRRLLDLQIVVADTFQLWDTSGSDIARLSIEQPLQLLPLITSARQSQTDSP